MHRVPLTTIVADQQGWSDDELQLEPKGPGDAFNKVDRHIRVPLFDPRDVGAIDAYEFGQPSLRYAECAARRPTGSRERQADRWTSRLVMSHGAIGLRSPYLGLIGLQVLSGSHAFGSNEKRVPPQPTPAGEDHTRLSKKCD